MYDLGTLTAIDAVDGSLTLVANIEGPYPVGEIIVTWSATDGAGNISKMTQVVSISDGSGGDGKKVLLGGDVTARLNRSRLDDFVSKTAHKALITLVYSISIVSISERYAQRH